MVGIFEDDKFASKGGVELGNTSAVRLQLCLKKGSIAGVCLSHRSGHQALLIPVLACTRKA